MDLVVIGGAGRVGLVCSLCLAELGHNVECVDTNREALNLLTNGSLPFYDKGLETILRRNLQAQRLAFASEMSLTGANAVFICVGTPPSATGYHDMSHFWRAADPLLDVVAPDSVVFIRSTVPIGTNAALATRWGAKSDRVPDVVSFPEFLQEGSGCEGFLSPSRVVVGVRAHRGADVLASILSGIEAPWVITTPENAEAIKYASNAFLAARISLVNELANVCEAVGADILEVIRGMGLDPRIGRSYLQAGAGYGGPCLGKDLSAFILQSSAGGYEPTLLTEVQNLNVKQHRLVANKLGDCLGGGAGKVIGILGFSFKPGTDDTRCSPSLAVASSLMAQGAEVRVYDPVAVVPPNLGVKHFDCPYLMADGADALVLMTAWPVFREVDFPRLRALMRTPLLLDARNYLGGLDLRGFLYQGIGRGSPDVQVTMASRNL